MTEFWIELVADVHLGQRLTRLGEVAAAGEHVLRVIEVARFRDRLAGKQR